MFATYKNKDELKLKFKLLNSSFVSLFLYFMILQSYGNIVNFGGIQNSVSIENSRSISKTKTETNNNSNLANTNLNTNPNPQLNLASINSGANININANEFINTANTKQIYDYTTE